MFHAYCIKDDDTLGAEYITILRDMIARNLPEGLEGDFTCYTDDPAIGGDGIIVRSLSEAVFAKGVYFGLNVVITGPLDSLIEGSVQTLSYRDTAKNIPPGTSVVIFDTGVMPHEVTTGWVPMIWRIGGGTPASFVQELNISRDEVAANVRSAAKRHCAKLTDIPAHDGTLLICAGGPSLKDELTSVNAHVAAGADVYAVNGALRFLVEHGIFPNSQVVCDARPENIAFCLPGVFTECLYASQCAPALLDAAGDRLTLWHAYFDGIADLTGDDQVPYVAGGSTAGLKAMCIGFIRGYRKIHLYGFDSSYRDGENHAYSQPLNDGERVIDAIVGGECFKAAPWMISQADDFKALAPVLHSGGCEISVHGTGLLPKIAEMMASQRGELTAIYDLAVSPPTYEFLPFLHEAEKARVSGGYTSLNVVFQPGPKHGFRDDKLPPDLAMRQTMLEKICVSACHLLPSVQGVSVLDGRAPVKGDIFPPAWTLEDPVAHYGPSYCRDLTQCLSASEVATAHIAKTYSAPFVAITLRHSDYWPGRNSDFDAWSRVAKWLEAEGFACVFVTDVDGLAPDGCIVCAEAAFDLDIRAAVYEQAAMCLGVSGGPTVLMAMTDCRYMVFNKSDPAFPFGKDWIESILGKSPQFSSNGQVVWNSNGDSYETVISELQRVFAPENRKTA